MSFQQIQKPIPETKMKDNFSKDNSKNQNYNQSNDSKSYSMNFNFPILIFLIKIKLFNVNQSVHVEENIQDVKVLRTLRSQISRPN